CERQVDARHCNTSCVESGTGAPPREPGGCMVYLPAGPSGSAPFGTALWLLLLFGLPGLLCNAPTVSGAIRCSSSSSVSFNVVMVDTYIAFEFHKECLLL